MKSDIIKIIANIPSHIDVGMSKDIKAFLDSSVVISSYSVIADKEEKIIICINLNKFTTSLAKRVFSDFVNFVGYGYLNFYIRDESGEQLKYLYVTANHELFGTKMEVIFR